MTEPAISVPCDPCTILTSVPCDPICTDGLVYVQMSHNLSIGILAVGWFANERASTYKVIRLRESSLPVFVQCSYFSPRSMIIPWGPVVIAKGNSDASVQVLWLFDDYLVGGCLYSLAIS